MPEVAVAIKEYDEMRKRLKGSQPQGKHWSWSQCDHDGWSYAKTAKDLGISKSAVVKAIQIATAIEKYPELAAHWNGQWR